MRFAGHSIVVQHRNIVALRWLWRPWRARSAVLWGRWAFAACSASASRRKAAVNAEGDRYPVALATAATGMPLARSSRAWARRCWRSHSMAPRPSSSRQRAVNWLGLRCTRRARSATVISWCHSRAAHCCSRCQSMARRRELAEAERPPVGRLCAGEGGVPVPSTSHASSSSAGPWACARGRPCCRAWARYCASGCAWEGGAAARCRHCAQPGWVLSSTRHKLPRWASKSCRAPGRITQPSPWATRCPRPSISSSSAPSRPNSTWK